MKQKFAYCQSGNLFEAQFLYVIAFEKVVQVCQREYPLNREVIDYCRLLNWWACVIQCKLNGIIDRHHNSILFSCPFL